MFSTLKLKVNSLSVSPTTMANSLEVSFFLSLTTSLTTPASPTADKSGNWYTAAALRSFSKAILSNLKWTSSEGSVISFSGGETIAQNPSQDPDAIPIHLRIDLNHR